MAPTAPVSYHRFWLSLALFPFLASTFYIDVAQNNGIYFARENPLKSGTGKAETKSLYDCMHGSDVLASHPIEGVAVWNRPDSQPTLAVAFYHGGACAKTRGKITSNPQFVMLLDPNRIRGVHVVNLKRYGLELYCRSWQGLKVQEELQEGGVLNGLDPKELPGSLVYWDENGVRNVKPDAIRWVNGISYEPLMAKRQISQYLKQVVEEEVNPELATDPVNVGVKEIMKGLNGLLGIKGEEVVDAPFPLTQLASLKLNLIDGYQLSTETETITDPQTAHRTEFTNFMYPPKLKPKKLIPGDLAGLLTDDKVTVAQIQALKVPMEELLASFNKVLDFSEDKRTWYHRFEVLMTYNLQVLANAWRIYWAWEKAHSETEMARKMREQIYRQDATESLVSSMSQGTNMYQGMTEAQRTGQDQGGMGTSFVNQSGISTNFDNQGGISTNFMNQGEVSTNLMRGLDPNRVEIEEEQVVQRGGGQVIHPAHQPIVQSLDFQLEPESSPKEMRSGISDFFGDSPEKSDPGGNVV